MLRLDFLILALLIPITLKAESSLTPQAWLETWMRQYHAPFLNQTLSSCEGPAKCSMPQFIPAREPAKHPQRIPRIIWQAWPTTTLDSSMFNRIKHMIDINPSYDYFLFTRRDWKQTICEVGPEMIQRPFSLLRSPLARVRFWQIFILERLGGVFVNTTVSLSLPLDDLIVANASAVMGPPTHHTIHSHILAYQPHHPILRETIDTLTTSIQNEFLLRRVRSLDELFHPPLKAAIDAYRRRDDCFHSTKSADSFNLIHTQLVCTKSSDYTVSQGYIQMLDKTMLNASIIVLKESLVQEPLMKYPTSFRDLIVAKVSKLFCNLRDFHNSSEQLSTKGDTHLGAVAYLLPDYVRADFQPRYGRKCGFNMSMNYLAKNWRPFNNYPVILMGESPWNKREMELIRSLWPAFEIQFICVAEEFQIYNETDIFEDSNNPLTEISK